MKSPYSSARRAALGVLVCLLALGYLAAPHSSSARGDNWKPVDPAELSLSAPLVEKDADAEALFWEVKVADEAEGGDPRTVLQHYVRIKIFNERGRESQSKIDILAPKVGGREIKITDIAGRTIKPDGSIVELKKEDIFERTVVKGSGVKVKAKSFAMPGVEPGSIIEYRWREVRGDTLSQYDRLEFSRDIPVQQVKYYIKPYSGPFFPFGMRAKPFNGQFSPFQKEKEGYVSTTMTNVPAFREEPYMPPEYSVRPWMLIYYTEDRKLDAVRFWKEYGKEVYEATKSEMKVSDEVKRKAVEVMADASTPEQKIERIFEFCRSQIKNVYDDANGMTMEQRIKVLKETKTPADTLKRGIGSGRNIDMLFAALAVAAGFDARVVNLADRGDTFFDASFPDDYFIRTYDIAVKVGDSWSFYDPASTYVPFGMLRWQEEGQQALLSDPKEPNFVLTPLSGPEKSLEKRTGTFKLSDDGTLEGDVKIEYTGHMAADLKEYNDDDSPAEREETLKNKFKERLAGVEITDIKVENVSDPVKPFIYSFHVRVPAYAQRTGKRLFIQPAFFQKGLGPRFSTATRHHLVYFHYPWSEEDHVRIELPEGFALDSPESPGGVNGGEVSKYEPLAQVTKDGRTLIYTRKFYFGKGGGEPLLFPVSSYPSLKNYFDQVNKEDGHTLALKQGATAATAPSSK
ncbi:MAG: hypothetical protein QOJ70_1023 [Acidobacteriota bacterium]|jgi:hypothetical protein|nr:hypothetical protein [Acidobacteriota bacterium]